jgi:hypothetical protein
VKPISLLTFGLGGVSVQLGGADRAQLARLQNLLARLFVLGSPPQGGGVRLQLSRSPTPERAGSTVYRARALTVARLGSTFDLSCGASQLRVTPGCAEATCFLAPDFFDHSPFEQREFFLLALLMLLRPHGLYGLHACALEHRGFGNDRGVGLLLAGASGSGKTTTSLELIRRGWRYLSDDAVLLRVLADASVQASAFRRGFSCTPETLARFPELTGNPEYGDEFGDPDGKRVVDPPPSFGGAATTCTPSLLVFPVVTAASTTTLRPLSAVPCLVRLCQQSAGIMTDTAVSQRQLGLLKILANQARGFELRLGRDALADPGRIDALLSGALREEALPCVSSSS